MITIIAGIVMLGILVFVHELGHFCVAKMAGVKVLKFSLGFGPKIVSKQWGETEYMICSIPLGGYVQMLGEGTGEPGAFEELSEAEKARSFAKKSVPRRTAIIAAGPLMNLIFPFLILPIAYMVGVNIPAYLDKPACIGYVVEDSVSAKAGFQDGDCILKVDGAAVNSWNATNEALITGAGAPLEFVVERNGQQVDLTLPAKDSGIEGLHSIGLLQRQDAVVGSLAPGMPAQAAGMEVGDKLLSVDGTPVTSWYDLKKIIQAKGSVPRDFLIQRKGKQLTLSIKPVKGEGEDSFLIGIAPAQESVFKRFGLIEAVKAGGDQALNIIHLTLVFIQKFFSGHVPKDSIGGPITVVQIAGQAAQTDLAGIISVLAFLSIQLGILNLLPIPVLDGGHLLFNIIESILGRPLSTRTQEIANQIGLVLIFMLMILAFYNDIVRLISGGM